MKGSTVVELFASFVDRRRNRCGHCRDAGRSIALALSRQFLRATGVAVACVALAAPSGLGQETPQPQRVQIPAGATSLEGIPTVRIDSAEGTTTRRVLNAAEAAKARLTVRVVDGQFYWATRDNRLLRLNSSGDFTYLSSELRIVVGK